MHKITGGKRLNMTAATRHDEFVDSDYRLIQECGMTTARDGIAWHLIETHPGRYDFSSAVRLLRAARRTNTQVIWDLFHFGWPDWLDILTPEFVTRYGRFAREFARVLRSESDDLPIVSPMNEISFMAWAGGETAYIYPFYSDRGDDLKRQLVRAAIEAVNEVRSILPGTRFVHPEPVIHIIAHPDRPEQAQEASAYRNAMYQAWDMLAGRLCPELGGTENHLDILGVNFYPKNEWFHHGGPIWRSSPHYLPFRELLKEVHRRYERPMFISETGTEDDDRPSWLKYVCTESRAAMREGVPLLGLCIYPILNHPGWDDERHCCNGLFDYAGDTGKREVCEPLKNEIQNQVKNFDEFLADQDKSSRVEESLPPDLICLSHLRWGFVFQRPQHLMSRFARDRRVFFVEEPFFDSDEPRLQKHICPQTGVNVIAPHLPAGSAPDAVERILSNLLDGLVEQEQIEDPILWYYTPMAIAFSDHLRRRATVYDCMDELSAFKGAPPELHERERMLLDRADLVFTGGVTLYEFKRNMHPHIYPFPSGVDVPHFRNARSIQQDPADQAQIPHPRLGFVGVIDERFDIGLLDGIARLRPDWHFVLVGPVVKIDPASLPEAHNIHYLGGKKYEELPAYLAGWNVAMLTFARNESTRFISPTKTPEYLAAGRPVVSTSIRDVVRPYKDLGLVHIADTPEDFVIAAQEAMYSDAKDPAWQQRADEFLKTKSWDAVWSGMNKLIQEVCSGNSQAAGAATAAGAAGTEPIESKQGAQTCSIS